MRSKDDGNGSHASGLDRPKNDGSDDSGESSVGRGLEALRKEANDQKGAYAGCERDLDMKSVDGDKQ